MSVKPNKKPSFALGLILILLLLAAVILGGSWVVRQAFLPRQSDARPAAAAAAVGITSLSAVGRNTII